MGWAGIQTMLAGRGLYQDAIAGWRRSLEPALQDEGSNHRKLLRHNGRGGERSGKRQDLILSGEGRGDERKRTADDLSKA